MTSELESRIHKKTKHFLEGNREILYVPAIVIDNTSSAIVTDELKLDTYNAHVEEEAEILN